MSAGWQRTILPMDSATQLILGAAVGVAVMRRRTAAWKAALWGGVAGTPEFDTKRHKLLICLNQQLKIVTTAGSFVHRVQGV